MSDSLSPATVVRIVAQRELNTRLRTRGFVIGTTVLLAAMIGYLVLQVSVFAQLGRTAVGLAGQATAVAQPLRAAAEQLGQDIETTTVTDVERGRQQIASGELDVLVSGSAANMRVLVESELDDQLRAVLNDISQREVLDATLLQAGLDPRQVHREVDTARVEVDTLTAPGDERGQRVVVALVMMFLLYMGITGYGTMVAQGVVEEKSSRVVEILLSSVRPWHLLLGKVIGIGLVGLTQLAILGAVGLAVATGANALTVTGVAASTLLWGLLWYLLGFFLYAAVFAGAGSLVSRQEDMQTVVTPITLVLVGGFVSGVTVLQQPDSPVSTVLSLVPPLSPILMPSRIATGAAGAVEIAVALVLTVATIAALTWLGGRVYRAAILHTGGRLRLRDTLRG